MERSPVLAVALVCALFAGCGDPQPSGVLQDQTDMAASAGDDLAAPGDDLAAYDSPRRDGFGAGLPDLTPPVRDLAGDGRDLAVPPVDDNLCDSCEQKQCRDVDGIDWYAYCFLDDDVITDGPGSGKKWSQLCLDTLKCARTTGCATDDPSDCYCGPGVSDIACLSMPQGVCRAEFEAAAESTHVSDVIDRLADPSYPVGAAFNLLRYCEVPICGAACGGGAHGGNDMAPVHDMATPHDLTIVHDLTVVHDLSTVHDLTVTHDLATPPDLTLPPDLSASSSCADLDQDGKPDCDETLVSNARFDSNLAGWSNEFGASSAWQAPPDALGAGSGSILVTDTIVADANGTTMAGAAQCISATAGATYRLFVQARLAGTGGAAALAAQLFASTDCTGAVASTWTSPPLSTPGAWTVLQGSLTAPATARSLRVRLGVLKQFRDPAFTAQFDNVLVETP